MLMHNSRIFYFSPTLNNNKPLKKAKSALTEHIIGLFSTSNMLVQIHSHNYKYIKAMLTTPKYRKLTCLYLLILLLDNAVFVALLLTLFLDDVFLENVKLFLVVLLEIFYDVCQYIICVRFACNQYDTTCTDCRIYWEDMDGKWIITTNWIEFIWIVRIDVSIIGIICR